MDLRPIFYVLGILLLIISLSMALPMLADMYFGYADWKVFLLCIIVTAFFGGAMMLSNSGLKVEDISIRQAFLLTTLSWLSIAIFGALPFRLSEMEMSAADSFFESMSGITTTGATVITNLEDTPAGLLLWRAILQWLGGIGFIIMAMSVLPFLKVGGMQLFRTESSEKSEKPVPRAAQLAGSIGIIYFSLTVICAIAYMFSGLGTFDAVAHAMTTIATGGFSTFDTSFAHYDQVWTEVVAIIFMTMGGLPFVLYLRAVRGNLQPLFRDSQVRTFLAVILAATCLSAGYLIINNEFTFFESVRRSAFSVVSVITGTGYSNGDYGIWGSLPLSMFFFLMVVGGCAGSTTCGIKIFRFQVLYSVVKTQIQRLLHPHGIFQPSYGGHPLPEDVPLSVMNFFFVYAACFFIMALALSFVGLDFITAMSGAITAISNVGPGLGEIIGPAGTFKPLPDSAKWILSFGMLLGRLELFTVLVLFSPYFWKS